MFDLLFVGNPAIDKAIVEPEDMPRSLLERIRGATPVSYTHLTLPTKRIV